MPASSERLLVVETLTARHPDLVDAVASRDDGLHLLETKIRADYVDWEKLGVDADFGVLESIGTHRFLFLLSGDFETARIVFVARSGEPYRQIDRAASKVAVRVADITHVAPAVRVEPGPTGTIPARTVGAFVETINPGLSDPYFLRAKNGPDIEACARGSRRELDALLAHIARAYRIEATAVATIVWKAGLHPDGAPLLSHTRNLSAEGQEIASRILGLIRPTAIWYGETAGSSKASRCSRYRAYVPEHSIHHREPVSALERAAAITALTQALARMTADDEEPASS